MQTVKLIHYWSTFWFYSSTLPFWVGVCQHGTSWLGNICPLLFAKALQHCQLARTSPVHSLFRSPQWCSLWFSSGLRLGHSKTLIFFWRSHAFVDLEGCFGSVSNWWVKFLFIFRRLISFISQIPLMLWKLAADKGFCFKMQLRICQEILLE